jgi:hypothetical protein
MALSSGEIEPAVEYSAQEVLTILNSSFSEARAEQ